MSTHNILKLPAGNFLAAFTRLVVVRGSFSLVNRLQAQPAALASPIHKPRRPARLI